MHLFRMGLLLSTTCGTHSWRLSRWDNFWELRFNCTQTMCMHGHPGFLLGLFFVQYKLQPKDLGQSVLWVSVWDNAKLGRNTFLGEIRLDLSAVDFSKASPRTFNLLERVSCRHSCWSSLLPCAEAACCWLNKPLLYAFPDSFPIVSCIFFDKYPAAEVFLIPPPCTFKSSFLLLAKFRFF